MSTFKKNFFAIFDFTHVTHADLLFRDFNTVPLTTFFDCGGKNNNGQQQLNNNRSTALANDFRMLPFKMPGGSVLMFAPPPDPSPILSASSSYPHQHHHSDSGSALTARQINKAATALACRRLVKCLICL